MEQRNSLPSTSVISLYAILQTRLKDSPFDSVFIPKNNVNTVKRIQTTQGQEMQFHQPDWADFTWFDPEFTTLLIHQFCCSLYIKKKSAWNLKFYWQ